MERALDLHLIADALGEATSLPTPEQLAQLLADVEVQLFIAEAELPEDVLATGWYLHGIASVHHSQEAFGLPAVRRAHEVAAHILDLDLTTRESTRGERLRTVFAAQMSSVRGGADPNAAALFRRFVASETDPPEESLSPGIASLEAATTFLSFDRARVWQTMQYRLRPYLDRLRSVLEVASLDETPYSSAANVIQGVWALLVYLNYGNSSNLEGANRHFRIAAEGVNARGDIDSRWVASHLLDLSDNLSSSSVWAVLPANIPRECGRAMVATDPGVLTLWPPQVELLAQDPSPLLPAAKRQIISFPTSAGKTLMAQFIVVAHLAQRLGSVCVVVPTRALAREVRRDMDSRLSGISRTIEDEIDSASMSVDVLTPEQLSRALRADMGRVLDSYSLFVIDEAHFVGSQERGWVLESALSVLHGATVSTHHRIVLLSAALGNRVHFQSWIGAAQATHSEWRGPRRATATYATTYPLSASWKTTPRIGNKLARHRKPLHGRLVVRTGVGPLGKHMLMTTEPVGQLVMRETRSGKWEKDNDESTRQYVMRAPIIQHLGRLGQVLIIEGTKHLTQQMAATIAQSLDVTPHTRWLADLVESRLGNHPLVGVLKHGVGFHHAALPNDIRAEVEDAFRRGDLRYLVATTTLIEGINLPARSVFIGSRGYWGTEGEIDTLGPAGLINAIGRAGRATKETEGWVIIFAPNGHDDGVDDALLDELEASDDRLSASSTLNTERALDALTTFEELVRQGQDGIFEYAGKEVADFISYVWFVTNALEELDTTQFDALHATLAWQQLDEGTRQRWTLVRDHALGAYRETPEPVRRRWSRTGTSLKTARIIESIVGECARAIVLDQDHALPLVAYRLLCGSGRLEQILAIDESRFDGFRRVRNSREQIEVNLYHLVRRWLEGASSEDIAAAYLSDVVDEDYRYEQLSDFFANSLDHVVPWILDTATAWLNEMGYDVCRELGAYIRHGVDSKVALDLMQNGVRSRRLARSIASSFVDDVDGDTVVHDWLAMMGLREWRERLDASPSEVSDLLRFTSDRDAQYTARALAGETVSIPATAIDLFDVGSATLALVDEQPPQRIGVSQGGRLVGVVAANAHDDVSRLLAAAIPLDIRIDSLPFADLEVSIRVLDPSVDFDYFAS